MAKSHLFGPIVSRRLGRSLGVDVLPAKTCPFDCVYCEAGRTTTKTDRRQAFVDPEDVLSELSEFLAKGGGVDYVTISGSGEPTLYAGLGILIREIKKRFGVRVAVITNAALSSRPDVRAELADADMVMPSLDSAREDSFRKVNRPVVGITAESVVDGLARFSREYKGRVWLEILLVSGVNDSDDDIEALARAVRRIHPERVQLNTVVRPPAEASARPLDRGRLEAIAARLSREGPTEIIAAVSLMRVPGGAVPDDRALLETLERRSCTLEDLAGGVGADPERLRAVLNRLVESGRVLKTSFGQGDFYEARDLRSK